MTHFVFDLDGVLILAPVFTANLARVYQVPLSQSLAFIHGEFQDCLLGKRDLKQILPRHIKEWGIQLSVEELLQFWFDLENQPNQELINYIQTLRRDGHHCSLATNQEQHRSIYVKEHMRFSTWFDSLFFSCELGLIKPTPAYFQQVTSLLHVLPSEIVYFDDRPPYAQAARDFGWQAYQYVSNQQTIAIINHLLNRA